MLDASAYANAEVIKRIQNPGFVKQPGFSAITKLPNHPIT